MKDDDLTAGSLALSARFTLRFQQASPLVKNLISIRSRSRFRGRSEMSTRCCGGPQVVWEKKFGPIGVSGSTRRQAPVWTDPGTTSATTTRDEYSGLFHDDLEGLADEIRSVHNGHRSSGAGRA